MHSGMERSLALLAALSGPGRRARPVGKAVGMLGWIGEAMAQVLRKVGDCARPAGRAPPWVLSLPLVLHKMEPVQEGCGAGGAQTGFVTPWEAGRCLTGGHSEERGWWGPGKGRALFTLPDQACESSQGENARL